MVSSWRWRGSTTVHRTTVTLCVWTSVGWQAQTRVTAAAAVSVNWSLLNAHCRHVLFILVLILNSSSSLRQVSKLKFIFKSPTYRRSALAVNEVALVDWRHLIPCNNVVCRAWIVERCCILWRHCRLVMPSSDHVHKPMAVHVTEIHMAPIVKIKVWLLSQLQLSLEMLWFIVLEVYVSLATVPVHYHITFKNAVLTYNIQHWDYATHVCDLIHCNTDSNMKHLWSADITMWTWTELRDHVCLYCSNTATMEQSSSVTPPRRFSYWIL